MFAIVHLSQHAVVVDPDSGLLHGCHHGPLHSRVAEGGGAGVQRRQDQVDTRPTYTEAEQSLHGGVDVDGVPVDDGVIWREKMFRC